MPELSPELQATILGWTMNVAKALVLSNDEIVAYLKTILEE